MNDEVLEMKLVLKREVYTFTDILGRHYAWDVSMAKALAEDPANVATVAEIDRENMQGIVQNNAWRQERVVEVDASLPGIGAPVTYEGPDKRVTFYILIDGTHRCVRAYQAGELFSLRLLTDAAAKACLLEAPVGSMPWEVQP